MTDQMRLPFFVYGTLRRGCGNYEWTLAGKTIAEVPGTMTGGRMFDNGSFPYVTRDEDPANVVVGEVMTVPDAIYDAVLRTLDGLEGYSPGRSFNHYTRVVTDVTLETGEQIQAYVYLASERTASAYPRIPSGDWQQRDRSLALHT
jgi:gamma-glutamylcyclotransferase (GGCT)/AIG2-like uncharacterized protein YtfP